MATAITWLAAFGTVAVCPEKLHACMQTDGPASGFREPWAIEHYQEMMGFRRSLLATDPSNAKAQRELAFALEDLAKARLHFGDVAEALDSCQIAFELKQKLLEADPTDQRARRDLSLAHEWLGNALFQAARYVEALDHHQTRLEISQRLVLAEPESNLAKRDLSVAFQNLGIAQTKFRRDSEALASYRSMLEINDQLATANPDIARYQFSLFVSHQRIALVLAKLERYDDAAESYSRGLELLRALKTKGKLALADQRWIGVGELVIEKYKHAEVAIGDWNTLMAQPAEIQPLLLDLRGTRFAYEGRFADAVQAAAKLRELDATPIWPLYNAGCVYSICAQGMHLEPGDQTSDQFRAREQLIADAVATIREAFAIGWDDIAHLQQDPDLTALRDRPEFQLLVDELKAKVKAADKDRVGSE